MSKVNGNARNQTRILLLKFFEKRSREIGAKYYAARSTVAENWLSNNTRWIQRQIASGKRIFDIGPEGARIRSKYYQREVEQLTKAGLKRVEAGTVEIKNQTYTLYEWIRQ